MDYISYGSKYYKLLENVLSPHQLQKDNNGGQYDNNIIDLANDPTYYKKLYNIPDSAIHEVLDVMYTACVTHNGYYCFSEKQKEKENGVFIDVDLYNDDKNKRMLGKPEIEDIITDYIDNLITILELNEQEKIKLHAFVLSRSEMTWCEHNNKYKEGYHILIPDLYLIKPVRKNLLNQLKYLYNYIDTYSSSVPCVLYGNLNPKHLSSRDKYQILYQYEITINKRKDKINSNLSYFELSDEINLIRELSLTFEKNIFKPQKVTVKGESLNFILHNIGSDSINDEDKLKATTVHEIKKNSHDAEYLCNLLDILDSKYYDTREYWWSILCAVYHTSLSNMSEYKYDAIAEWFSKKSSKYNEKDFNVQWNDIKKRYNTTVNHITLGTIKYYAKQSNEEQYSRITKNNSVQIMKRYFNSGDLNHYNLAKIVHSLMNKYVRRVEINHTICVWYVFIDNLNSVSCSDIGQLYKWVNEGSKPNTLSIYVSEHLSKVVDSIIKDIDIQIDKMSTETIKAANDMDNLKTKKKSLTSLKFKLGDTAFKNGILAQCSVLFTDKGFINKLDKAYNTLGVKNGILILPSNANEKLVYVDYFNENLYVEMYTNANYKEYDENDYYIKEVLDLIKDIIVEEDALEYILIYLSTSISNMTKETFILLLRGVGSNGKSTILEFMLNTLGSSYSKKLSLGILTNDREASNSANSAYMDLKDTRFGYFSEPNKVEKINTGRLKEVLGNETLTGRQMYNKQENFKNVCTLVAASNYDFTINCNDHGIWRRIKYYEFKSKFVESPCKDNKYEKKIKKGYISKLVSTQKYIDSFLSILIHYYCKYICEYNGDLNKIKSSTIDYETDQYRGRQDDMQRFISNHVKIIEPEMSHVDIITVEEFANCYIDWLVKKNTKISTLELKEIVAMVENSSVSKFIKINIYNFTKYFDNVSLIKL